MNLPRLQNFTHFSSHYFAEPLFKFLRAKPSITWLYIDRTHVFYEADIFAIFASLIDARSQCLYHVEVDCTLPASIAHTLSRCTSLRSIFFSDRYAMSDESFRTVFSSPAVQKSVHSIRVINSMPINACTLAIKARCTKLRCINLAYTGARSYTLSTLIRSNAQHLCSLILRGCESVDYPILEALAYCRCLRNVELNSTAVSGKAVQAYIRAKRPNWKVIVHDEGLFSHPGLWASGSPIIQNRSNDIATTPGLNF